MQGSDLTNFINKIPSIRDHFLGIYSIDTLPKSLKRRTFLFSNTAFQNEIGEHWICICKTDNKVEIFDSLGLDYSKQILFSKYCKFKTVKELTVNETSFQLPTSSTCGLFVIYFAIQRFHNLEIGFTTLLKEIFSENNSQNEVIVKEFLEKFEQ